MRRALIWSLLLSVIVAAALIGYAIAMSVGLERMRDASQHRLDTVSAELESDLGRYQYLPSLLEMTPGVFELLAAPGNAGLRDKVNRYLQGINATVGASNLYVLDRSGVCLAAADWNEPGTPVGSDFSFRPYMKDALAYGRGRFYGVGITSKRAGYYLSYALYQSGQARGVATVKVKLEDAEQGWRTLPGNLLLVDKRDVVILSSREELKFRPLAPLTPSLLSEIAETRAYGDAALEPLDWQVLESRGDDAAMVRLGGTVYLSSARHLSHPGWRLIMLDDVAPVRTAARVIAFSAALAAAVLLLLAIVLWQRQRALRSRLASQAALQAAYAGLEAKVVERTAELRSSLAQLGEEVETRKAIEADLRATQGELVHGGKMVALGQMSAGIVHELNQPLSALRTLSDNACVLLEMQRLGDVHDNLQHIARLVDRLGRLTRQLKSFAHKTSVSCTPVNVQQVIDNAQVMVSGRLREQGVEYSVAVTPAGLTVLAEEARLEQVLVNLLGNAIEAMADAPEKKLCIEAAPSSDGRCCIAVSDTGPGIRADIQAKLFEPFTSSKPAGTGLGLGLLISANIVREFGGSLSAHNLDGGGARFEIELPLAETIAETSHG